MNGIIRVVKELNRINPGSIALFIPPKAVFVNVHSLDRLLREMEVVEWNGSEVKVDDESFHVTIYDRYYKSYLPDVGVPISFLIYDVTIYVCMKPVIEVIKRFTFSHDQVWHDGTQLHDMYPEDTEAKVTTLHRDGVKALIHSDKNLLRVIKDKTSEGYKVRIEDGYEWVPEEEKKHSNIWLNDDNNKGFIYDDICWEKHTVNALLIAQVFNGGVVLIKDLIFLETEGYTIDNFMGCIDGDSISELFEGTISQSSRDFNLDLMMRYTLGGYLDPTFKADFDNKLVERYNSSSVYKVDSYEDILKNFPCRPNHPPRTTTRVNMTSKVLVKYITHTKRGLGGIL